MIFVRYEKILPVVEKLAELEERVGTEEPVGDPRKERKGEGGKGRIQEATNGRGERPRW